MIKCEHNRFLSSAFALFVIFLVIRLLCANYIYFWEGDDTTIAMGVVSLIGDAGGPTYRYAPQVGYYRLVQIITMVVGGDLSTVPLVMVALSAVAGAITPFLAFYSFPDRLTARQRLLLSLALHANPIIWMSSEYGNTAIAALPFGVAAIVICSRRPGIPATIAALGLLGLGVLIRADTILLTPIIALLIYHQHRSLRAVLIRAVAFAVVLTAVYGLLFAFDGRMHRGSNILRGHLLSKVFRTQFWVFLIWAISPIPLLLAAWGLRDVAKRDLRLLAYVVVWCLPTTIFYFASTFTPRYFLLTTIPISICAVIGLETVAAELACRFRSRRVWVVLLGLSLIHLFVGLGRFRPGRITRIFRSPFMMSHDGPVFTGALLYRSAAQFRRSLLSNGFGSNEPMAGAVQRSFDDLGRDDQRPRTVFLVLGAWSGSAVYYHALVSGAKFASYKPHRSWTLETWFTLGRNKIMIMNDRKSDYNRLESFPASAGDELWVQGKQFVETASSKVPEGLKLERIEQPGGGFHSFRFVQAEDADTRPTRDGPPEAKLNVKAAR